MTNCSYKKKLKASFDKLIMVSPKTYYVGRCVASAVLAMKEVDPMIARDLEIEGRYLV